ncbi:MULTISPECIES: DUF2778 domain-containing protein [Methylobacterium]|uniref:Tlde1 domain-containing protein n=1 Tax=Methylobacterium thuringiense TaxID=1003091 RepID=A0ABQ4TFU6_9HYPH|nr:MULTISPECIES: DUF2778 domain-containing protein [Methylobacterium]TXN24817.1 DUF2778 domain-containing protein [Methylobacterium sp. WL9]GJE54268.1 hypothetical protein EKPJFOCH_0742 [Methylobacterium thuringiense]
MEHAAAPPDGHAPRLLQLRRRGPALLRGVLVAVTGLGIVGGLSYSARIAAVGGHRDSVSEAVAEAAQPGPALDYDAINTLRGALLASLSPSPATPVEAVPASPAAPSDIVAAIETTTPFARQEQATSAEPEAESGDRLAQTVPLPVPRPPELRGPNPLQFSRSNRASRRVAAAVPQAPVEDTRSFFDKLFGVAPAPTSPVLAYAALEQPPAASAIPRQVAPAPVPPSGGGVAVYDISARTVTLPNGEKLEAHSGLGESMDDPRSVATKMRGATPPGVYDLTEREALFHGVRAIRLNPVGGAASIYGRAGLLAHTYMLGPNGASNGCISFRDYNRFLQAYLNGQIARVVVVPGNGQDALPSVASRGTVRTARAGNDG